MFDLMFSKRPAGCELIGVTEQFQEYHTCNTTQRLVEVVTFLERILYSLLAVSVWLQSRCTMLYLQDSLILLAVCMVRLLCRADIVFEVGHRVFPGLQSLGEELGYF